MVCRKATESEPAGVVTTTTLRQVLCFRKTVNEENLKLGYIKLFRSMQDNALWRKSVKKGVCEHSAWIDILLQVRWSDKPQQVIIGNHVLTCNRGESLNSLDTWASRWGWKSKKRVKTFLKTLQDADMIRIETVQISTRLTVVNFPSYQDYGNDLETERKRLVNGEETTWKRTGYTEEECKNDKTAKTGRMEELLSQQEGVNSIGETCVSPVQSLALGVESVSPEPKPVKPEYSEAFTRFWNEYPAKGRVEKMKAGREWRSQKLDSKIEAVLQSLEAWKACALWTRPGRESGLVGEYVKAAFRWIRDKNWEEFPQASNARTIVSQEFQIDESKFL